MKKNHNHHYVPVFYLDQWKKYKNRSGRKVFFAYKYENGKMIKEEKSPSGVAYEKFLYSLDIRSAVPNQVIETSVMTDIIDNPAAPVLHAIIDNGVDCLSLEQKNIWQKFLVGLLIRNPVIAKKLPKEYHEIMREAIREAIRKSGKCEIEFNNESVNLKMLYKKFKVKEEFYREVFLRCYPAILDSEFFAEPIGYRNNSWIVIDTSESCHSLLTSDKPLLIWGDINSNHAFLLPLSPRKLFISVSRNELETNFKKTSSNRLVKDVNTKMVCSAVRYIFSSDNSNELLINARFGKSKID